jgi:hypothetical protein
MELVDIVIFINVFETLAQLVLKYCKRYIQNVEICHYLKYDTRFFKIQFDNFESLL